MHRRQFLKASAAVAALAAGAAANPAGAESWVGKRPRRPGYRAAIYVPGYHPELAYFRGRPIADVPELRANIPAGYRGGKGGIVLLSRVPEGGGPVVRRLMPVKGHDVDIHPDGDIGVLNSQNGATMVSFDPETLDLAVLHEYEDGAAGGGHSVFLPDGAHLAVTERSAYRPYTGDVTAHEGRIAIRDVKTLKAVETYSCHGIAPHEVQLMADGKHLVIANYGSTYPPDGDSKLPYLLDPSITIVELVSGKLVERIRPDTPTAEVRHVVGYDRARIYALQNRFVDRTAREKLMASVPDLYIPDFAAKEGRVHDALPVLHAGKDGFIERSTPDMAHMVRPQSITYDPVHDDVIATFPGANRVIVFNGADGSLKRQIDTAATGGLRLPRGLALHPDGEHYIVAGAYQDIALFRRGSHARVHDRSIYTLLFGHSHLTAI